MIFFHCRWVYPCGPCINPSGSAERGGSQGNIAPPDPHSLWHRRHVDTVSFLEFLLLFLSFTYLFLECNIEFIYQLHFFTKFEIW